MVCYEYLRSLTFLRVGFKSQDCQNKNKEPGILRVEKQLINLFAYTRKPILSAKYFSKQVMLMSPFPKLLWEYFPDLNQFAIFNPFRRSRSQHNESGQFARATNRTEFYLYYYYYYC